MPYLYVIWPRDHNASNIRGPNYQYHEIYLQASFHIQRECVAFSYFFLYNFNIVLVMFRFKKVSPDSLFFNNKYQR